MENKICDYCKTENEPQYKYCKNCGRNLNAAEETPNNTAPKTEPLHNESFSKDLNQPSAQIYGGVSVQEMVLFIGPKAENILPKFTKMEVTGSKISWNWPAAILGFIFGPIGSALWFFYRKMKKPAIILAIIGAVINIATGIMLLYSGNVENVLADFILSDYNDLTELLKSFSEKISVSQFILYEAAATINNFASILSGILSGIYGYYIYKKHCIKTITEYRNSNTNGNFYGFGLSTLGGRSTGLLAIGILIMFTASSVVDLFEIIFKYIF